MTPAEPERHFYTVCFEGDVKTIVQHLFEVLEPYGLVVVIGTGNEFELTDALRAELAQLRERQR